MTSIAELANQIEAASLREWETMLSEDPDLPAEVMRPIRGPRGGRISRLIDYETRAQIAPSADLQELYAAADGWIRAAPEFVWFTAAELASGEIPIGAYLARTDPTEYQGRDLDDMQKMFHECTEDAVGDLQVDAPNGEGSLHVVVLGATLTDYFMNPVLLAFDKTQPKVEPFVFESPRNEHESLRAMLEYLVA